MPKVFVVCHGGHDFSKAEKFGELVYMTQMFMDKFQVTPQLRHFYTFLKESTDNDYLLLSGPTAMNCIATALFVNLHGKVNLLLWKGDNGDRGKYILKRMDFNEFTRNFGDQEEE